MSDDILTLAMEMVRQGSDLLARVRQLEAVATAAREHRAAENDEADPWGYRLAAAREQVDAALAALDEFKESRG